MSTHLLIISPFPEDALCICPPYSPCNPPFFSMELNLSTLCSSFNPSLSRQGADLAYLYSFLFHNFVIVMNGTVPFLLAKEAPAFLPTAHFVVLKPSFPIRQAQRVQAFLLEPAPFCKLSAGFDSTSKSFTLLPFPPLGLSLCPCHIFLSSVFSSFLHLLAQTIFSFSFTIRPQWVPSPSFSPGNDRADEMLCFSHLKFHLISLLLLFLSTALFSRTGCVLSHASFSRHKFPQYPLRNLCFFVTLVVSSLVFATTDKVLSYAALAVIRPRTPLISFRTV